jgi:hypothetical protein
MGQQIADASGYPARFAPAIGWAVHIVASLPYALPFGLVVHGDVVGAGIEPRDGLPVGVRERDREARADGGEELRVPARGGRGKEKGREGGEEREAGHRPHSTREQARRIAATHESVVH